jgi:hypothetical protein
MAGFQLSTNGRFWVSTEVPGTSPQVRANSTPCGVDPSGAYTNMLCPNEHIYSSAYLVDTNDRYRFYYQNDGNSYIFDTSTNPWTTTRVLWNFGISGTAWIMVFESEPGVATRLNAYSNGSVSEYVISANTGTGDHFARLDTDGCLRFYDQGGAGVIATYC